PYTTPYFTASPAQKAQLFNWVAGTMVSPFDAATTTILTNPAASALAYYVKNPNVFHCPGDPYLNPFIGNKPNARSYSMNSAVGTVWWSHYSGSTSLPVGAPVQGGWLPGTGFNANQTAWLTYGKMSSFTRPGPANTFVIMDENPISINDDTLAVPAFATPPNPSPFSSPDASHGGSAGSSFADGHVVMHKWQDVRTYSPSIASPRTGSSVARQSPDNPDCFSLAPITSAPR